MKVLISAASRHGATSQIATAIETVLQDAGLETELLEPERVGSLAAYDAFVVGSGVYAGHWLAPARTLVERSASEVPGRPVWLFSSGPIGDPAKPSQPPADGLELTQLAGARDHQVFEGKIDRGDLGLAERAILRVVGASEGDFRPWEAILQWARGIAAELATVESRPLATAQRPGWAP